MLNQMLVQTQSALNIIVSRGGEASFNLMAVQWGMDRLLAYRGCDDGLVQGVGHGGIKNDKQNDCCIVVNERSVVNLITKSGCKSVRLASAYNPFSQKCTVNKSKDFTA